MRPRFAFALMVGVAAISAAPAASAQKPTRSDGAAIAEEEETTDLSRDLPFYDADGRRLREPVRFVPPAPKPPEPPTRLVLGVDGRFQKVFLPILGRESTLYEATTYFGVRSAGLVLGAALLDEKPAISAGVSFLRFGGGVVLYEKRTFRFSLLVPDLNVQVRFFLEKAKSLPLMATVSTDVLGLRVSGCLGRKVSAYLSLRGPTLGGGLITTTGKAELMVIAGALVDGGLVF